MILFDPVAGHDPVEKVPEIDQDDEKSRQQGLTCYEQEDCWYYEDCPSVGDPVGREPLGDVVRIQNLSKQTIEALIEGFVELEEGSDDRCEVDLDDYVDEVEDGAQEGARGSRHGAAAAREINEVSGAMRSARVPAGGIRILDRVTSLDETCTLSLHS